MAIVPIRIGSLVDIHQYDNGVYDDAIDTGEEPISIGDPVDPHHAVNLRSLNVSVAVANVDNPSAELNLIQGRVGQLLLAVQVVPAGQDVYTLYAYDAAGPAANVPYVVTAAPPTGSPPGTERWIAIAGKYVNQPQVINAELVVNQFGIRGTLTGPQLSFVWGDGVATSRALTINTLGLDRALTLEASVALNQSVKTTSAVTFASVVSTAGFGCNGAASQATVAVNVDSTDLPSVIALCNQLRAALIANGICT